MVLDIEGVTVCLNCCSNVMLVILCGSESQPVIDRGNEDCYGDAMACMVDAGRSGEGFRLATTHYRRCKTSVLFVVSCSQRKFVIISETYILFMDVQSLLQKACTWVQVCQKDDEYSIMTHITSEFIRSVHRQMSVTQIAALVDSTCTY